MPYKFYRLIRKIIVFLFFVVTICYAQVQNPNIIILHIDDLGFHDLSCYGSKIYETPHIDQVLANSYTFQSAYANYPRCVPSRYAMMSATYPVINGQVPDDGYALSGISDDSNFVKLFNKANYHTFYFGKWHLGDGDSSPTSFGYQYSFAAGLAGSPISYFYPFNVAKENNKNVVKNTISGIDDVAKEGEFLTDVLTTQFINYIKSADRSKPFLGVLSFYAVHQPLEAKPEAIMSNQAQINSYNFGLTPEYIKEGFGRTKLRQDNAVYAAMVESLDDNIGRVFDCLEKYQFLDNTIVVISSDHGGLSNDGSNQRNLATSNYPLRAGKGWLYEGGIKVPLAFYWKGKILAQSDVYNKVMLMDVFPTLFDLVTNKTINGVDGLSLKTCLLTKDTCYKKRKLFWYSPNHRPKSTGDLKSIAFREGNWKMIHFYEENKVELYNLKKDISENTNLASQYPKRVKRMMASLDVWKNKFNISNK